MPKRAPVKASVDERIFRRTATQTKRVNIAPRVMRGGTRF